MMCNTIIMSDQTSTTTTEAPTTTAATTTATTPPVTTPAPFIPVIVPATTPAPKPTEAAPVEVPDIAAQFAAMKAEIESLKAEKDNKIKELSGQVKDLESDRAAQKEAKRRSILAGLNPIMDDVYQWAPDIKTADPDTAEGAKALQDWAASKKELFRGTVAPQPTGQNNGDKRSFAERVQTIFGIEKRNGFNGFRS